MDFILNGKYRKVMILMRKQIEKEYIERKFEYIDESVTCNKCGKEKILSGEKFQREVQANKFQSFDCSFGYGSHYDMENWEFDLCEDCLEEIVKTFKIVPDGFGEDNEKILHPQIVFEEWKVTGIINMDASMTPDEIKEYGSSYNRNDEEDE
jgi:hypothetical protein